MTEFQRRVLDRLVCCRNRMGSADTLAYWLGYRPSVRGRLGVTSALRSMQAAGFVVRLPPEDRWGHARWCITDAGLAVHRHGGVFEETISTEREPTPVSD